MTDHTFLLVALGVIAVLGLVALGALIWLFRETYPRWHDSYIAHLFDLLHPPYARPQIDGNTYADYAYRGYSDFLESRKEFWRIFVQFLVTLTVILVIAILLLTGVIEPDAGLPILGLLGGAAIGQGGSAAKSFLGPQRPDAGGPDRE